MKLGVTETINQLIPSQMDVEPGQIFLGLILDTLSGRTPLYRLENFFEQQDTELLLSKDVSSACFADHNVARVMDKAYEVGSMKIFSEFARKGVKIFGVNTQHVSFDTTSVNVFGDHEYSSEDDNESPFRITYGYSKDHRPDLKQFLISMLCVDRNVPIFGKIEDGNRSDKTINNDILSSVSKHMSKYGLEPGAFIYIADSAMVGEKNLKTIGDKILFISRLPATYNECGRVIKDAVDIDEWNTLGALAITKPTKKRPVTNYKAFESEVTLYDKVYRATVIHSSANDRRRMKRIDRELEKEFKNIESHCKVLAKEEFYCLPDAQNIVNQLQGLKLKYYRVKAEVKELPKYKRGRPKGGIRQIREMRYVVEIGIEENKKAVERFREEAGCFVLINNIPKDGERSYDSYDILKAYKDQHGIEQNFRFLKDPAIVNGIFLKKPERIEVLGLILLLSLLIWRMIEYSMRQYVVKTGCDLPGWERKRTERPTSFMLLTKFYGVMIIKYGNKRILNKPLTKQQKEYLFALGISQDDFINPRRI